MHLIIGASGMLGRATTGLLLERGERVRGMTRDPSKLAEAAAHGVEVLHGDLRDQASVERALDGARTVLAAAHAFTDDDPRATRQVDDLGHRRLIDRAARAGVDRFVYTSARDARPDHPIELMRIKDRVEQHLRESGLEYTILRASMFAEFWAALIADPVVHTGKTTIFGRGTNPLNFVSIRDVARAAVLALTGEPSMRNRTIELGGPENLSLVELAELAERIAGRPAKKVHVPLPVMRLMALLTRPFRPVLSRQIQAGIVNDTTDQRFEPSGGHPLGELTTLEEVLRRRYATPQA